MNTVIIGQLKSGTRHKFDTRRLDKRLENLLFDNLVLNVTLTRRIMLVKYNNHVAISCFVKKNFSEKIKNTLQTLFTLNTSPYDRHFTKRFSFKNYLKVNEKHAI